MVQVHNQAHIINNKVFCMILNINLVKCQFSDYLTVEGKKACATERFEVGTANLMYSLICDFYVKI